MGRLPQDSLVIAACKVAHLRTLDLDHARAEIGELPRRERRSDGLFERDDCYSLQREQGLARLLKKAHLLRCARPPRSDVLLKYACARRFLVRLVPGTFLTSL